MKDYMDFGRLFARSEEGASHFSFEEQPDRFAALVTAFFEGN